MIEGVEQGPKHRREVRRRHRVTAAVATGATLVAAVVTGTIWRVVDPGGRAPVVNSREDLGAGKLPRPAAVPTASPSAISLPVDIPPLDAVVSSDAGRIKLVRVATKGTDFNAASIENINQSLQRAQSLWMVQTGGMSPRFDAEVDTVVLPWTAAEMKNAGGDSGLLSTHTRIIEHLRAVYSDRPDLSFAVVYNGPEISAGAGGFFCGNGDQRVAMVLLECDQRVGENGEITWEPTAATDLLLGHEVGHVLGAVSKHPGFHHPDANDFMSEFPLGGSGIIDDGFDDYWIPERTSTTVESHDISDDPRIAAPPAIEREFDRVAQPLGLGAPLSSERVLGGFIRRHEGTWLIAETKLNDIKVTAIDSAVGRAWEQAGTFVLGMPQATTKSAQTVSVAFQRGTIRIRDGRPAEVLSVSRPQSTRAFLASVEEQLPSIEAPGRPVGEVETYYDGLKWEFGNVTFYGKDGEAHPLTAAVGKVYEGRDGPVTLGWPTAPISGQPSDAFAQFEAGALRRGDPSKPLIATADNGSYVCGRVNATQSVQEAPGMFQSFCD